MDEQDGASWVSSKVFLAVAFLVAAIVAGAVVVVRTGSHSQPAVAATTGVVPSVTVAPSTGVATSSTTPSSVPAASSLPDQTMPATPPVAAWVSFKTLELPVSPVFGPRVVTATVMSGYQHSPTGALFAAADNRGRFSLATDWLTATLTSVADTPGRAAFIKERAPYGPGPTPTPGTFTQIVGYTVVSYTPGDAVIQLVSAASDGSLTVGTDTVVWENNDWKILLQPDGSTPPVTVVQSTAGFIPWGTPP